MTPTFTICRLGAQDKVSTIDKIIKDADLKTICQELTGNDQYQVNWVEKRIKGKMFTLETDDKIYYITYTPPRVESRDSYLQSVPTAFGIYLKEAERIRKRAQFCLYLTKPVGNNKTPYFQFTYKLLLSIGVKFINIKNGLSGLVLQDFNNVSELIKYRDENRSRNRGNQSSYITDEGTFYHVYGKTFGANHKETSTLCLALCKISDKPIRLFQISDNDSKYLSEADTEMIKQFASQCGATIEILDDSYEFEEQDGTYAPEEESLRSPRFNFNLLEKTGGHKRCSLCNCNIESIVQGAHIYPVSAIKKRTDLTFEKRLEMATDKNNGIWLCENHHKLFDRGLIRFNDGKLIIVQKLNKEQRTFVEGISPNKSIEPCYYNSKMKKYFEKRDEYYRKKRIYD